MGGTGVRPVGPRPPTRLPGPARRDVRAPSRRQLVRRRPRPGDGRRGNDVLARRIRPLALHREAVPGGPAADRAPPIGAQPHRPAGAPPGARSRAAVLRRVGTGLLPLRHRGVPGRPIGSGPTAERRPGDPPHRAPARPRGGRMNVLALVVAIAALLAVVVLACVVAAMLRALDRLRAGLAALRSEPHDVLDLLGDAVPVGDPAPAF